MRPATAPKDYNSVIETCLVSMCYFHKYTKYFIKEVLCLFLSISKVNFTQLSRYTTRSEQSFRINFSKSFNWFDFNSSMVKQHCGKELSIAIDPSFVSKSCKKTAGVGYFWSGCAGAVKWYVIQKQEKGAFSMAEIKTMNHNILLLKRFINMFAINPNKLENT